MLELTCMNFSKNSKFEVRQFQLVVKFEVRQCYSNMNESSAAENSVLTFRANSYLQT